MKEKRKYDLFEMMDECLMRKDAECQHRATYLEGLQKLCVAVTPTGVDIGFIQRFFGDRVADFDAGVVQTYDYPIWKTIGYLLSFDMDFAYAFLNTESGQDPDVNRDLVGMSEYMEREYQQQKVAAEAFKAYLTAAGALARRIGSSTYEAWRGLLMEAEFTDRYGTAMFEDVSAFDSFLSKMNVELRRLWADVKIRSHETIAQTPPTHPRGRAKN